MNSGRSVSPSSLCSVVLVNPSTCSNRGEALNLIGDFTLKWLDILLIIVLGIGISEWSNAYPVPKDECGHLASVVEGFAIVLKPEAMLDIYLDVDPSNAAKYILAFDLAMTILGTPGERGAQANSTCLLAHSSPALDI